MPLAKSRFTKSERRKSCVTSDMQAAREFKKAVTVAKNRREMFWRSQAPELADMLTHALEQLKKTVHDPHIGVDALADFYRRDADIFERCDDLTGARHRVLRK